MSWELANPYGILVDEENNAWHTGRVNAVLPIPGTQNYLVGSETGGLWVSSPADQATTPLSNDWTDPDISTLIPGADPSIVYAGTSNGSLYVSDVGGGGGGPLGSFRAASLLSPTGIPVTPGRIWAGVVDERVTPNQLILACDNGLLWADIPAPGGDYVFQAAVGGGGAFSGVVLGLANQLIAAGHGAPGTGTANPGMFLATRSAAGQLSVAGATVNGISVAAMRRTSLASCDGSPTFAYALTAQLNPQDSKDVIFLSVLRTTDGGRTWNPCGNNAVLSRSGNQADANQAIAVAASAGAGTYTQLHVAMGVRRGPFISSDGGDTWIEHGDSGSGFGKSPHLHGDIRSLLFDTWDPLGNMLLVGSDGGLARTRDLGKTWASRPFNYRFPILQFCGAVQGFRGGSSASPSPDNLVGGGTQDNDTIWSLAGQDPTAWRVAESRGDGGYLSFVLEDSFGTPRPGLGIATDANAGQDVEAVEWDGTKNSLNALGAIPIGSSGGPPLTAPKDQYVSICVVGKPRWPASGGHVVALCGSGSTVYGFIGRTGSPGQWTSIASLPLAPGDFITAVGSYYADPIYVGTKQGRLLAFDPTLPPTSPTIWTLNVQLPTGATLSDVKMLVTYKSAYTIALFNRYLLRLDGLRFVPVGGAGLPTAPDYRSLTADDGGRLYLAHNGGVLESGDDGESWVDFSTGLPVMPHSADIYFGRASNGPFLYLATWGRSAFRFAL